MIEIELPDGSIAEFPEGTPESVIEQVLAQEYGRNIRRAIATTPDGGTVYQMPDGSRAFSSAGYSTTDPEAIDRLMQGATPLEVVQSGFDRQAIAENPVSARAAKVLQGVPFLGEYTDEAAGLMFGDGATQGIRTLQDAMQREKPGQSLGLQVGGGILSAPALIAAAGPAIAAKAPVSMAGRFVTGLLGGATAGGIEGAVSGYGAGTDDQTRADEAKTRGAFGAVVGGGVGGLLPLAASGIRRATDFAQDVMNRQSRRLPGLSREATEQLLLRGQADDIGGAGLANIRAAGPDAMIADAGPAMAKFADQSASMSMQGANILGNAVEDRASASAGRLRTAFDDVMGQASGARALSRDIRNSAQPMINDAYNTAYNTAIDYSAPEGRAIESLLSRLPGRKVAEAVQKATERMIYDGMPSPQIMVDVADDGSVKFRQMPNVMQLDYLKRAFDRIAQDSINPQTMRMTDDGAFASRIARDLRKAVGDAVPAYRDALSEAADEFSLQNALQMGRDLFRRDTTVEMVEDWASSAGASEKRALASGLRSQIEDVMGEVKRAQTDGNMDAREAAKILKDLSSGNMKAKLRAVFGEDEAARLAKSIDEATAAMELRGNIATNSKTAPRTVGDAMLRTSQDYSAGGIARQAASGGILTAPRRLAEIAAANTPADRMARDEELYREIAQYLVGPRGASAEAAAQEMAGLLNYIPQASAVSQTAGQIGGGVLGLLGHLSATRYPTSRGN